MSDKNHRKSQIVAQHVAQKVLRERQVSHATQWQLNDYIDRALEDALQNAIFAGHSDKAGQLALAQLARIELQQRGLQLDLGI